MTDDNDQIPDRRAIGVFDSGVGGLTVLHECLVNLPHEDFVYLGDTGNFPYGPKPLAEVRRLAFAATTRLVGLGVKLVIVGLQLRRGRGLAPTAVSFRHSDRGRRYARGTGGGAGDPRAPRGSARHRGDGSLECLSERARRS